MLDQEVELLTRQIHAKDGGFEYAARVEAKRRLGYIPPRKTFNGAMSNYYSDPVPFEHTEEEIALRKEFIARHKG